MNAHLFLVYRCPSALVPEHPAGLDKTFQGRQQLAHWRLWWNNWMLEEKQSARGVSELINERDVVSNITPPSRSLPCAGSMSETYAQHEASTGPMSHVLVPFLSWCRETYARPQLFGQSRLTLLCKPDQAETSRQLKLHVCSRPLGYERVHLPLCKVRYTLSDPRGRSVKYIPGSSQFRST